MGASSTSHDAVLFVPAFHGLSTAFSSIFQWPLFTVHLLSLSERMGPALLSTVVVTVMNTSQMVIQHIMNFLTELESELPDLLCDMEINNTRLLVAFTEQLNMVDRCFWAQKTSTEWWDCIIIQIWDDKQWLQNFRMWKATFLELRAELAPALWHKDTKMRAALSVEKCVAIAVQKLETSDCYRSLTNQFGVGTLTIEAVLMEVGRAINHILLRRRPTLGSVREIVDEFAAMEFPNCGEATDGTRIPILAPDHLAMEYINIKGYFSMVLQVLVDHCGHFTGINVGWSRKVHDARIFRNSGLYRKLRTGTYFPDQKIPLGDVEMPIVILRDPAYLLLPWIMKPYTGNLDSSKDTSTIG
ncbi:uncharacterized protein LOC135973811 isoform X1 [Chrysemys picta bellii]|uniref:uncharacterized protein LOC135973811 isoform X1 n=1 Tax=Chrysemys picta bellii TaxID=8478 RepID=UPI0032B2373D